MSEWRAMHVLGKRGAGGKVVSLTERLGKVPAHPALAQLRGYWEALRAGGGLPSRAQIDPRGIEQALEFAFIAERAAPGVACFRLAGMHLNQLMGMEVRGMPLTTFFEPASRDEVGRQVERAFAGTDAVELSLDAERGIGRPELGARLLLLPLRTETGQVARLLGGLVAEGAIGRAPRRFRLASVAVAVAVAPAPPSPPAEPAPPRSEPAVSAFHEPPAPFEPAPAKPRGRHLRLVHSQE
jgi:hypothetical protein